MKVFRMLITIGTCMAIACTILMSFGMESVSAGTWDNAYTYYNKYGNSAVFNPRTTTNGYIFCATKGNKSTSSIKYKTVGWKMTFVDESNKKLQVLYFKLGGNYLKLKDSCTKDGYVYGLYSLSLSKLKSRLNTKVKNEMNQGSCRLILDACMVVSNNGVLSGTMDDSGIKTGKVYTSYKGIAQSQSWSDAAKVALLSYFNKNVQNLFFDVNMSCGNGIKSVSGSGRYCYGTKVTVEAEIENGYEFDGWTGSGNNNLSYSFYISQDVSFVVEAKPASVKVQYYRNFTDSDKANTSQKFYYTCPNQRFDSCEWTKSGYYFGGWAESRNGDVIYPNACGVNPKWILENKPSKKLYARWQPNVYTFRFVNSSEMDPMNINADYENQITLPNIEGVRGWSLNPIATSPEYECRGVLSVKDIVDNLNLADSNGALIIFYAIRDSYPQISSGDLYYSLEDALGGRITEAEIASHALAYDAYDGDIAYGINENTSFVLSDYDSNQFLNMQEESVVSLNFQATNSMNNTTTQAINVYVVDTESATSTENIGQIRFISNKYFIDSGGGFVDENAGGLCEDSCWKNLNDYYTVLMNALEA